MWLMEKNDDDDNNERCIIMFGYKRIHLVSASMPMPRLIETSITLYHYPFFSVVLSFLLMIHYKDIRSSKKNGIINK